MQSFCGCDGRHGCGRICGGVVEDDNDDEPQVVFAAIAEGTLPPAAAGKNRAPTPRSETGNRTPTPGTEEYQALIKFPGILSSHDY